MSSELAAGIARIAPLLPTGVRRDLRELLAYDVAVGEPVSERALRFGLLCELLEGAGGEIPSVRDYEVERTRHAEPMPSAAQLSRRYGGWLRAVRTASWLAQGGSGRPPVREPRRHQPPYDRREALLALVRCRRVLGEWPTPSLYAEWARVRRLAERRWGDGRGRVPGPSVLRRLFAGFERAAQAARRLHPRQDLS